MKWRLSSKILAMAALIGVGYLIWTLVVGGTALRYPPGITAPDEPRQTPPADPAGWTLDGHEILPVADFEMEGRVLSKSTYRFDTASAVSPVDLMMGWQVMSDQAVLDAFSFNQRSRWGFWRTDTLPVSELDVTTHTTNIHIIPATSHVKHALGDVRRGELVRLRGSLVNVRNPETGWTWDSSLSRTDTDNGACEILWLRSIESIPVATGQ